MSGNSSKLLGISEAAARLGVHPNTLRGWVDRGLVASIRLPSGYRRFSLEQIEQIERDMVVGRVTTDGQSTDAKKAA